MIWAHTVDEQPEEAWEPLSAHLERVARRCAMLAAKFGAADIGWIAGMLHDLGKAKPAFQHYLKGGTPEPHAAEGARAASALLAKPLGRMLGFVIAGHHAGLANGVGRGGGLTSLDDRLAGAADLSDFASSLDLPSKPPVPDPLQRKRDAFEIQFFVRMVFSCLVDADRLETEAFHAETAGSDVERGWSGSLETLRDRLEARLSRFGGSNDGATEPYAKLVAARRAEVLTACRQKAAEPPGLFSLTVPTGGGKTLSSLAFALDHAIRHGLDRVIYVIPFTSIIDQTAAVFRDALQDEDDEIVLPHHSAFDWETLGTDDEGRDGVAKLRRAAENWDRPIVVTTAVQFFESLFANHPSRCRKLHNMTRAVIVLDEAQTLPLKLLRPCLTACAELARGYGTSVVWCTATQPAVREEDRFTPAERLVGVREIMPDPQGLYRALKRVRVRHAGKIADDALIATLSQKGQVLVIVNNRHHARDLVDGLTRALDGGDDHGVRLLTTALTAADRRAILEQIREDLKEQRPVRLVATSLIEAGVDVDFPEVWRAVAGIDSIAQAAGRCNREGRLGTAGGQVVVFEPEEAEHRRPPPELRQFAEVAASVLRDHDDPLALDTVRAYFAELYWRRGDDELDALQIGTKRGVLRALRDSHVRLDYPFADIGVAFRLIEETTAPVIIPASDTAPRNAPADVIDALRFTDRIGGIARRLQPFLVQVPRRAVSKLRDAGALELLRPERFGTQFAALADPGRYDPQYGLDWQHAELRAPEGDIH